MSFRPKVSIVIPVYNGSNFLRAAIDSALAQTYENCEVVVINDGSTDGGSTAEIARSYGDKIRYFEKENGGVATALNLGIEKMEGEYFSWLSHDDQYLPDKVSDQIKFLEERPEYRDAILYGNFTLIDETGKRIADIVVPDIDPERFFVSLVASSPVSGCTVLVPKKCFEGGLTFQRLRTTQDYDLWFRLSAKYKFIHAPIFGVLSRQHVGQDSRALTALHRRESEELYLRCLKVVKKTQSSWSKSINPAAAYREMAFGLIAKECFESARYAFRLYQVESGFSWRTVYDRAVFGAVAGATLANWSHPPRALYRWLFGRQLTRSVKKTRKILIVTPAITPIPGGLSEQSTLLAETFTKNGYAVDVITEQMQPDLPIDEMVGKIHIHRLWQPRKRNVIGLFGLSARLGWLLIKSGGKYDLCIIRTVTSQALVAGFLKSLGLIRLTTVITAETGGEDDEIRTLADRPFSRMIVYFLNKNDYINSNNSANYKHYLELGFTKNKLTKIYNGVLVEQYYEAEYPKNIERFIFLAELNREKGVRELLEAFALVHSKNPQTKLYVGGYGKEEGYIKKFIVSKGLSSAINFVGYVKKAQKQEFFNKGDCFVFPSYSEGFGLVIAEAAVYKRAIISTPVADLQEIFGSTIQFCNIRDVKDLAEKMQTSINTYTPGSLNYDELIDKLSIQRTVQEFLTLCR